MPGGRPTQATEYVKAKILAALRDGNYRHVASQAAGIDYATLARWMQDPRHRAFREDCERAEAEAELQLVGIVRRAAEGDPKLALEFLSRRHPERWAATAKFDTVSMLRNEARNLASEYGLDEDELVRDAEEILRRNS